MLIGGIFLGFVAALVYVLLLGQSDFHANGCVGKLRHLVLLLPGWLRGVFFRIGGERARRCWFQTDNYCCWSLNPFLPGFYVVLVGGGHQWATLSLLPFLPLGWQLATHLFFCVTLLSFVAASTSDPGTVATTSNRAPPPPPPPSKEGGEDLLGQSLLYPPDEFCFACQQVKPRRTKHCHVCQRCVVRFDHHCPWINNDVGADNTALFFLFLLTTGCLCMWCGALGTNVLLRVFHANMDDLQVAAADRSFSAALGLLFYLLPSLVCMSAFGVAISYVLFAFAAYNLYMALKNITTYESFRYRTLSAAYRFISADIGQDNGHDRQIHPQLLAQMRLWFNRQRELHLRIPAKVPNFFDQGSLWSNLLDAWGFQSR